MALKVLFQGLSIKKFLNINYQIQALESREMALKNTIEAWLERTNYKYKKRQLGKKLNSIN